MAAAAAADVVLEVLPQQPPPTTTREPAVPLRDLSVSRVVQYLYLASLWVSCAGVAAATVSRRALGENSPLCWTFIKVSIGSLVFPALVILVSSLRLLRATFAAGFRSSLRTSAKEIQIQSRKMFEALTWKVVLPVVLVLLVTFLFFLLGGAGVMVLVGLLPLEESHKQRIMLRTSRYGDIGCHDNVWFCHHTQLCVNALDEQVGRGRRGGSITQHQISEAKARGGINLTMELQEEALKIGMQLIKVLEDELLKDSLVSMASILDSDHISNELHHFALGL